MSFNMIRLAFLIAGLVLVAVEVIQSRRHGRLSNIAVLLLGVVAVGNIAFNAFLWINHINFPLNLDLMEGTVLQHFQHAAQFQPIYPAPTAEYVPLAYNALYYVVSVPFGWVFGVNLFTLRLVSILATVGSGVIIYGVVHEKTGSQWWGLLAVGLFTAAYRVMDTYLDNAHSDSAFLFAALLGSYIIDRYRARGWSLIAVIVLIASFWFKQHGALFAVGGVLFLTWRDGVKRSLPYWIVAILLGPVLYLLAGPSLFGSYFHYFTWEVPRNWSEFNFATFRRYLGFIIRSYPLLALSAVVATVWQVVKRRNNLNIWHFQLVFAMLTGLMGTLDIGSADNVYIPMGAWFILMGVLGLHAFVTRIQMIQQYRVHLLALFVSFTIMLFNPLDVTVPPSGSESYDDLINVLNSLDGTVYAPSLGQLQNGFEFYPAAHWVALEDMIRGPGRDTTNHPNTRLLLESVIHPNGSAFILTNYSLDADPMLNFLLDYYVLDTDFGDRFRSLGVLPKRFNHGWPRYLYRYAPQESVENSNSNTS